MRHTVLARSGLSQDASKSRRSRVHRADGGQIPRSSDRPCSSQTGFESRRRETASLDATLAFPRPKRAQTRSFVRAGQQASFGGRFVTGAATSFGRMQAAPDSIIERRRPSRRARSDAGVSVLPEESNRRFRKWLVIARRSIARVPSEARSGPVARGRN